MHNDYFSAILCAMEKMIDDKAIELLSSMTYVTVVLPCSDAIAKPYIADLHPLSLLKDKSPDRSGV